MARPSIFSVISKTFSFAYHYHIKVDAIFRKSVNLLCCFTDLIKITSNDFSSLSKYVQALTLNDKYKCDPDATTRNFPSTFFFLISINSFMTCFYKPLNEVRHNNVHKFEFSYFQNSFRFNVLRIKSFKRLLHWVRYLPDFVVLHLSFCIQNKRPRKWYRVVLFGISSSSFCIYTHRTRYRQIKCERREKYFCKALICATGSNEFCVGA